MALEKNIKLKVTTDTKQADANLKAIDKNITGIGTSLKSLGGYIGLAFGAQQLGGFLTDSIKAYIESERVASKLGNTLKGNTKVLIDYASALQNTTRFEDDSIISGMSRLALFTKDENLIKRLTKATLDFASSTETDLGASFEMMSKAITGNTIAFGKMGLKIEDTGDPVKNLNLLLEKINKTMGGSAEAEADTTYGRLEKLKNKFESFKEEIGSGLVPTLNTVANSLDRIADGFGQSGGFGDLLDKYLKVAFVVPTGLLKLLGMIAGDPDYDGSGDIMSASKDTKSNITQSNSFNKWKNSYGKIKDDIKEIVTEVKEWEKVQARISQEIIKASNGGLLGREATGTGTTGIIGRTGAGVGKNGIDSRMQDFVKENSFFVEQLRGDIQILEGEFNRFWQNTFGEANSLLEQFLMNFVSGLANLGAQSLFGTVLNFLLPGVGSLAGMAMKPQVINVNLGNETVERVVVGNIRSAQQKRLL